MNRCKLTRRRKRWARWGCAGWKLGPANHRRVPFKPLGAKNDNKDKPELPTSAYNGRLRSGVGLPVVGTFWPDPTCIPSTQTPSTPKASWPHVHHQYVSPIVLFLSLSTTSSLRHPSHPRLTLGGWLCLPHPHHCPSNPTSSSQELPSRDEDFPSFHWSFWMLACSHTKDGGPKPSGATRDRARHRSFADRLPIAWLRW